MVRFRLLLISLFTIISLSAFSQSTELLSSLPETKEDFIASEAKVLNTIDWLETTPVNQEAEKRQLQKTLLIG